MLETKGKGLLERVCQFVTQEGLLPFGDKVVVGVSGGPDSVALVHILSELQKPLGIELYLAHLNHGLRGQEATEDARYVADLASVLGLPLSIGKADVAGYRSKGRLSWEEAARGARYSFLAEVAGAIGARHVAVGHTANDQAETILMNIIRGTGISGLKGMQAATPWPHALGTITVVRPLLTLTRRETEDYCLAYNLKPVRDYTNLSLKYVRNKVRLELMPLLKTYNPRIVEALLRLGKAAEEDAAFIEEHGGEILRAVAGLEDKGVTFDLKAVAKLPKVMKRHLMRSAVRHLLGDIMDLGAVHIEALVEALDKGPGKSLTLPRGLAFTTSYDTATLTLAPPSAPPLPYLEGECRMAVPGQASFGGWRILGTIEKPAQHQEAGDQWKARLDYDLVGPEVIVRPRRPGDRFQPLGMNEPKKLQDFMVDCKIPRAWRDRVPIVASPAHILWVVGWRIDERVKVTEATKRILVMKFQRGEGEDA